MKKGFEANLQLVRGLIELVSSQLDREDRMLNLISEFKTSRKICHSHGKKSLMCRDIYMLTLKQCIYWEAKPPRNLWTHYKKWFCIGTFSNFTFIKIDIRSLKELQLESGLLLKFYHWHERLIFNFHIVCKKKNRLLI